MQGNQTDSSGNLSLRKEILGLPFSEIRKIAREGMLRDDVIALWFGEGDDPTPKFITDEASRALETGKTFYTLNRGIGELRQALSAYMTELYGARIGVDRVTVTASGMNGIMIATQCLAGPNDNVVIVTPIWPNFVGCVQIMGAEPRFVSLDKRSDGWGLDLDKLLSSCDGGTRAVIVNSPNNPTGWMMSGEQQKALLSYCRQHGIWVIADEVYARIVYDRPSAPSFLELAEPDDLVFVINSFSKSWSMTGWRIGWLTAPSMLGETLEMMNEYNVAGATTFAQHAGIVALAEGDSYVKSLVDRYRRRRELVFERLKKMSRVRMPRPEAAFYAFFAVDGMTHSTSFAKQILREHGIGLAPGSAFGGTGEGHLRLCYANSESLLSEAMDRLESALS
tara:strand:- start:1840 stop:3021 length:1182 start_codon:yes stop_codon:yes gene_type:complete